MGQPPRVHRDPPDHKARRDHKEVKARRALRVLEQSIRGRKARRDQSALRVQLDRRARWVPKVPRARKAAPDHRDQPDHRDRPVLRAHRAPKAPKALREFRERRERVP